MVASTVRPSPSESVTEAVSPPGPPIAPSASRSAGLPRASAPRAAPCARRRTAQAAASSTISATRMPPAEPSASFGMPDSQVIVTTNPATSTAIATMTLGAGRVRSAAAMSRNSPAARICWARASGQRVKISAVMAP